MMMYSRSMIVLTLVTMMIGLVALPSNPQRKIAKDSKKNPPPSSQQEETEIPIELLVPEAMPVEEVKERVTKIVSDILNGKGRRGLAALNLISSFAVQITGMKKTECASIYSAAAACFEAIIMSTSDGKNAAPISKLKGLLDKVIHIKNNKIQLSSGGKKGAVQYPNVTLINFTPYPVAHSIDATGSDGEVTTLSNAYVTYSSSLFCSIDWIVMGIPPDMAWQATSRGLCLVRNISASLTLPDNTEFAHLTYNGQLWCTDYYSVGTSYSEFSIIMGGADGCCVKSSHEDQNCGSNTATRKPSGPPHTYANKR